MGDGLADLWGLGESKVNEAASEAQQQARASMDAALSAVNANLQKAVANASPDEHASLSADRNKVIEAYQLASSQMGDDEPAGQTAMDRVLAAAGSLGAKAAQSAEAAAAAHDQWNAQEDKFDDMMLQVNELADAGHPKSGTLQELCAAVRHKADGKQYGACNSALDEFVPKLESIWSEHMAQCEQASAGRSEGESLFDKFSDAFGGGGGQDETDDCSDPTTDNPVGKTPSEPEPSTGSVHYRITDEKTGQLVEGATLSVAGKVGGGGYGILTDLPEGQYEYGVTAKGFWSQYNSIAIPGGEEISLEIELVPADSPQLPETDDDTGDVEGYVIGTDTKYKLYELSATVGGIEASTRLGRFYARNVPPGRQSYTITAPGYVAQSGSVLVTAGNPAFISAALTPDSESPTSAGKTGHVWVQVIGPDRETLNDLQVAVAGQAEGPSTRASHWFFNVPEGQQRFKVVAPGYVTQTGSVLVTAGQSTSLMLSIKPTGPDQPHSGPKGSVTVNVTDAQHNILVQGATVTLTGPKTYVLQGHAVTFNDIAAGNYTYEVTAEGYRPEAGITEVHEGSTGGFGVGLFPLSSDDETPTRRDPGQKPKTEPNPKQEPLKKTKSVYIHYEVYDSINEYPVDAPWLTLSGTGGTFESRKPNGHFEAPAGDYTLTIKHPVHEQQTLRFAGLKPGDIEQRVIKLVPLYPMPY